MEQLEMGFGEPNDEEAHYFHVLFEFCSLVQTYGSKQVLWDLEQMQRSIDIPKGS